MLIVGIDYSMSCPAVYVGNGSEKFLDGTSHFLTGMKKYEGRFLECIHGDPHRDWTDPMERYNNIALWTLSCFGGLPDLVVLEDYSMGSKGTVFNIGENTGILKYHLWKSKIPLEKVPPTVLKKFWTGKGNSDKVKMYEKFKEEQALDLCQPFSWRSINIGSPIGDIVDAFALYRYGLKILVDRGVSL
jgi:hypothetical protein